MKDTFIDNEIWMLTYGASFQRAYAYTENASEVTKGYFKNMTSGLINNMLNQYKKGNVSDDQHIENIKAVRDNSRNFSEIFNGGEINFGIAQKMLNLYLKYQWCLGNIPEPPHFPVDRIIQQKLNKNDENNTLAPLQIEPWTRFKDETHYLKVINFSRELAKLDSSVQNLTPANIELTLFQRR
tara:strand:- start:215 stop:763 length:549 start_codon:yes stop_codon:yes gene_type:complete